MQLVHAAVGECQRDLGHCGVPEAAVHLPFRAGNAYRLDLARESCLALLENIALVEMHTAAELTFVDSLAWRMIVNPDSVTL